ncbi:putative phytosulfokines 6 [Apium graveolens]|uniref:putative phytosulfokines 6 n=1 Tax=Apium graveolens TaxID=4045 RepID=UPI003D7B24F8
MKQSSCYSVLLLLFLIASQTSARFLLTTNQGSQEQLKLNNLDMKGGESFEELMGLEECKNGDEECFKRRAITEVHLDYIYTQHHKP